ncbi:Protein of unknown function [Gryllus bimaculatus]|nr:Protein of unknown function [Gryllus bimaculatus]
MGTSAPAAEISAVAAPPAFSTGEGEGGARQRVGGRAPRGRRGHRRAGAGPGQRMDQQGRQLARRRARPVVQGGGRARPRQARLQRRHQVQQLLLGRPARLNNAE